jgi:hypothetical protein
MNVLLRGLPQAVPFTARAVPQLSWQPAAKMHYNTLHYMLHSTRSGKPHSGANERLIGGNALVPNCTGAKMHRVLTLDSSAGSKARS